MIFPSIGNFCNCFSKHWKILFSVVLLCIPRAALASNSIKVMTFNLRYASAPDGSNSWSNANQSPQRKEVVLRVISNYLPDVIGFQEGEDGQIDYLDANLPPFYAFERQKPSGGGGNENAAFAYNTNLFELTDRGVISLGSSPGGGYWNNTPGTNFDPYVFFPDMGLSFPRLTLWGALTWKTTRQEMLFYTTHYDFNDVPQVRSSHLIVADSRARNDLMPLSPLTIVVGDFNSTQTDNDWSFFTGSFWTNGITGDFTDSWRQVHGSWTDSGTIHGFNGGTISEASRIDWVLHRGGLTATQCVIVTDSFISTNQSSGGKHTMYPSDHYPVMAVLRLPEPQQDFDRDRLPDDLELASTKSLPADPDTDNDLLLDGQEDLNGNGSVDGGETDPSQSASTQLPTDIRHYQMDGVLDYRADLLASHGLDLYWRFDGRYLYVATQDAGEGSDHFVFVTSDPDNAVAAPWAKGGQVAQWTAYLADENDSDYQAWHDASGTQITNVFTARSSSYFENGGHLEGVIDLALMYGAGFTDIFYIAAAPYGTGDGGTNYADAQVPAGNGDGDILGASEYVRIDPGDIDGDGINDYADPDKDGDGLPDAWESVYGMSTSSSAGNDGGEGDLDNDGALNKDELFACTNPTNANSTLEMSNPMNSGTNLALEWSAIHGKDYVVDRAAARSYSNDIPWICVYSNTANTNFPVWTNMFSASFSGSWESVYYRLSVLP